MTHYPLRFPSQDEYLGRVVRSGQRVAAMLRGAEPADLSLVDRVLTAAGQLDDRREHHASFVADLRDAAEHAVVWGELYRHMRVDTEGWFAIDDVMFQADRLGNLAELAGLLVTVPARCCAPIQHVLDTAVLRVALGVLEPYDHVGVLARRWLALDRRRADHPVSRFLEEIRNASVGLDAWRTSRFADAVERQLMGRR